MGSRGVSSRAGFSSSEGTSFASPGVAGKISCLPLSPNRKAIARGEATISRLISSSMGIDDGKGKKVAHAGYFFLRRACAFQGQPILLKKVRPTLVSPSSFKSQRRLSCPTVKGLKKAPYFGHHRDARVRPPQSPPSHKNQKDDRGGEIQKNSRGTGSAGKANAASSFDLRSDYLNHPGIGFSSFFGFCYQPRAD